MNKRKIINTSANYGHLTKKVVREVNMKWTEKDGHTRYIGEKYSYAFAKGLLFVSSFDSGITITMKVKDLKTAKQIAECLEK